MGIPTLGTVGILIRAKKDGEVPLIVPPLHNLRRAGAWVSDAFCQAVVHSAGEVWP